VPGSRLRRIGADSNWCGTFPTDGCPAPFSAVGSVLTSDHPPSPSIFGENILSLIVSALTADPALWAKTLLLVTYDENGGFFDPVAPVTAPPRTAGEYVTAPAVPDPTVMGSPAITGPIGLGFRVPMLIISNFSRGGFVSSDLFDHTSVLRFLETRFGAEVLAGPFPHRLIHCLCRALLMANVLVYCDEDVKVLFSQSQQIPILLAAESCVSNGLTFVTAVGKQEFDLPGNTLIDEQSHFKVAVKLVLASSIAAIASALVTLRKSSRNSDSVRPCPDCGPLSCQTILE
jgi:Phosphoesterase family